MITIDQIKNLYVYRKLDALLLEIAPYYLEKASPDYYYWLRSCDDYETLMYAVIDGRQLLVLDSINGDVINRYNRIDDFLIETEAAYIEYCNF